MIGRLDTPEDVTPVEVPSVPRCEHPIEALCHFELGRGDLLHETFTMGDDLLAVIHHPLLPGSPLLPPFLHRLGELSEWKRSCRRDGGSATRIRAKLHLRDHIVRRIFIDGLMHKANRRSILKHSVDEHFEVSGRDRLDAVLGSEFLTRLIVDEEYDQTVRFHGRWAGFLGLEGECGRPDEGGYGE